MRIMSQLTNIHMGGTKMSNSKRTMVFWIVFGAVAICLMFATLNFRSDEKAPSEQYYDHSVVIARATGIEAAKAAGIELPKVTWSEIEAQRKELGDNRPKVYWYRMYPAVLYTEVNGEVRYLIPEDAIIEYGDDEQFLKEYAYLML